MQPAHVGLSTNAEIYGISAGNLQKENLKINFKKSMDRAEATFLKLGTAKAQDKEEMVVALGEAWDSLKSLRNLSSSDRESIVVQAPALARIMVLRGESRWAVEDIEVSRQIYCTALQFARGRKDAIDTIPELDVDGLEDLLKRLVADKAVFIRLEEELASPNLTSAMIQEALGHEERSVSLAIADAAVRLGGTYMNHDSYRPSKADDSETKEHKILLCENAIGLAKAIWQEIVTPETEWNLLDCKYNKEPYCWGLRNPDDKVGRRKIYEEVLEIISGLEEKGETAIRVIQKKAQCYNMLSQLQPATSSAAEIYLLVAKAAEIALQYADKGFDVFLSRMFLNNGAATAFSYMTANPPVELEGVTIEMIDEWHDRVQEMCAKEIYSHFYDGFFCFNAARTAYHLGNLDKAKVRIQKALEVCDKHASSTAELRERIQIFCTEKKIEL